MTAYKCEGISSSCNNFQSAICLHCNHRLCIQHLIEHDKIVFNDVKNVSDLIEETFREIKEKSEKSRIACDDLLPIIGKWRIQQLEKVKQIYENELQSIGVQEKALENFHQYLFEQVDRDARQSIERVQRQQTVNTEVLHLI